MPFAPGSYTAPGPAPHRPVGLERPAAAWRSRKRPRQEPRAPPPIRAPHPAFLGPAARAPMAAPATAANDCIMGGCGRWHYANTLLRRHGYIRINPDCLTAHHNIRIGRDLAVRVSAPTSDRNKSGWQEAVEEAAALLPFAAPVRKLPMRRIQLRTRQPMPGTKFPFRHPHHTYFFIHLESSPFFANKVHTPWTLVRIPVLPRFGTNEFSRILSPY